MSRSLIIMIMATLLFSCDETSLREGASEFASLEPSAMRVLVTPQGIGQLVEVANPDGFPLDGEQVQDVTDSRTLSLGPLAQTLPVASRMANPEADSVVLTTRHDGAAIFVPVRVSADGETRICRWQFQAARIETTTVIALVDANGGRELGVVDMPAVELTEPTVTPVTDCDDTTTTLPEDIEERLVAYVSDAIAESAARSLPTAPLEILGLLRRNLQLTRLTAFDNRSGTLVLEGAAASRTGSVSITSDGLSIELDATADAQRARCAPPVALEPTISRGAGEIEPALADRFDADFALAISSEWLSRVAQSSTLAGYACRGLEDARPAVANTEAIAVDELLLEELRLDQLPIGSTATLVLVPGSLPAIDLRPSNGTIGLDWDAVQIEIYGELFGARTRLARVVANVELGLRPRAGGVGALRFDIESIAVAQAEIESELVFGEVAASDLARWTQRTLLLLLEDELELPLPLQPAAPVRVVGVQVRADDISTFLRFE